MKLDFKKSNKGFTLIEFIVILSIFAIMASVALLNFTGFRSNVATTNLAHDIALTIRQAQVFGWSTKSVTTPSGEIVLDPNNNYNPRRTVDGIFFPFENGKYSDTFFLYSKTPTSENQPMNYESSEDSVVDTIKIQGASRIVAILIAPTAEHLAITSNGQIPSTAKMTSAIPGGTSIAFSRPRPEATLWVGQQQFTGSPSDYIGIYIASKANTGGVVDKVIIISRLGKIDVQ